MPTPKASLTNLPLELLSHIFTLSSNPALVLTCRDLNRALAPLSKSVSTRINFLLVRYRNNYIKAVIKGLRWAFFDLELLQALDRIHTRELAKLADTQAKAIRDANAKAIAHAQESGTLFHVKDAPAEAEVAGSNTIESDAQGAAPIKKRKKYHLPGRVPPTATAGDSPEIASPSTTTASNNNFNRGPDMPHKNHEIPLPHYFAMPRRLFKTDKHMELVRTLLYRGAHPSYPSHYPLVRASQRGDVEMVRMLLAAGAEPDQKALRWACVEERDEVLDIFLELGVMPDGQCLSWCVEKGKTRMIDRLLALGVVPDLKTVLGF